MASLDVGEAFLKGLTFKEVHELKGGTKRVVCMTLPRATASQPSGAALLRQLPEFADFNEGTEALEMLKGGFGLADAPNVFTNRVDNVFKAVELMPTLSEGKVYVKHKRAHNGEKVLTPMVSAHMDDFKATGEQHNLQWLRDLLKRHFGDNVNITIEDAFIHAE